jgi:TP901 family phage tail tape measure protein
MADEQIVTNIVATSDFSSLIADVQRTTASLSKLQQQLSLSNKTLAAQAGQIQKAFGETLRSTGQFTTHFVTVGSEIDTFGKKLDGGKLKLGDYFRTWQQHTKTSGGLIRDLAKQQVALQNAVVQPLGKSADGLMKFNVHVANGLNETVNKTALARKELQIYNKVIQDGGVQLINWGKNTQWAGRQLTVGLTVPLAAFGMAAAKAFREADQELVRLTKVYGGLSAVSAQELAKVRRDVSATARELSAAYGSSFKDTIALAADIAATGKQGNELLESTKEATRLSILGEVDRQEAMKATLAIQSAFKQNTAELTESINFLNAVENQTSTSLADLVEAIPKAGPVVKALGGDVEDLALYLTAMREGGINASEGANALKSALASIINPTKVAKEQFMGFGIDLEGIVNKNAGNLTQTILSIQSALDTLDPLKKSQAIEQLFGKFQFARMNALFENLGKQGSQTLQVLDLMKASSQDLANVAGRELSQITESASGQYKRAIESLKADLAGLGDQFLRIGTFFIKVVDGVVKFINKMPDPIKNLLGLLGGITALAGPLIMLTGVFANFIGYVIKGIGHLRSLGRGGEGFKLLTPEILAAEKAGSLIEKTFYNDAEAANVLKIALSNLTNELTILQQKAASGSISVQPTLSTIQGNIVAQGTQRVANPSSPYIGKPYTRQMLHQNPVAGMTTEEKAAQTIFGVTPGPGPVNQRIGKNPQIYMTDDMPRIKGLTEISGVSSGIVAQEAAKWHSMTAALAMQSKEEIALLKREVASTGTITTELSTSYQALLPQMTNITSLAAQEAKLIVAQLQSGKVTVDQARAKIISLNAQVEAMMAETAAAVATSQGRLLNITTVPLTGQPVVDPVTGKSNMKEMFHKSKTSMLVDKIARSLGVRTSGGGYSIETTRPKRFKDGDIVPGPNVNADVVPALLTPGEFVVKRNSVTPETLPILRAINSGSSMGMSNDGYMPANISNSILQSFGYKHSGSKKEANLVGRWGMILPQSINDSLAGKLNGKGALGSDLINALQDPDRLVDLDDFLAHNGVDPKDRAVILKNVAKNMVSKITPGAYYKDPGLGSLAFQSIDPQIKALESKYPGISLAYQKDRMTPGRRDTRKTPRPGETQAEANKRGGPSQTGINIAGQRPSNYGAGSRLAEKFGPKQVYSHFTDVEYEKNTSMLAKSMGFLRRVPNPAAVVSSLMPRGRYVPRARFNKGGMVGGMPVMGYNTGDLVRGLSGLRSKIRGTGTLGKSPQIDENGNPIVDMNSGMATSMAGMAMMMGGSQMPGMAGSAMTFAGLAMQMSPMLKMMKPLVSGMGTFAGILTKVRTIGIATFTALRIGLAALLGPIGLISAAIGGVIALFLKMKKDATDAGEVNRATYGLTATALEEVGIKYKTVSERIKEVNQQLELNRAKVKSSYETYTKSGVAGLDITLKALREGIASAKKEDKESVGLFDKAKPFQVNQLAASMKAQYVALGMSVQEATNQIYILIKASNKSSQALDAISSESFKSISDKASGALYSVELLGKALSNKGLFNAEEFSRGLDNMLNSLTAYKNSLMETTKKQVGLTDLEANREVIEKITKLGADKNKIDEKTLDSLKAQNLELAAMLGRSESLASIYAKYQLYLSGASAEMNLSAMGAEDAVLALQGYNATKDAAEQVLGNTEIAKSARTATAAAETANKILDNAKKQDSSYIDAAIKNRQKLIKALEEERSARLKILDLQERSANFETEIQQAQLRYQEALAAGDMAQAAQEQLNIQKLSADRQRDLARQSINDKADAERKKLETEIEKLQAQKDAQAKALSIAQSSVAKKNEDAAAATAFLEEIKAAIANFGGDNVDDVNQFQALLNDKRSQGKGSQVQDLIDKFSGGYQSGSNMFEVMLKNLKSQTNKELEKSKYDKFDLAVQTFQEAVDKFAGIESISEKNPKTAGTEFGPTKTKTVDGKNVGEAGRNAVAGKTKSRSVDIPGKGIWTIFKYKGKEYAISADETTIYEYENGVGLKGDKLKHDFVPQMAMGGAVKHFEPGGEVSGPGTGTSDSIPAYLSNGEYVIKAAAVEQYGVPFFDAANAQKLAGGGIPKDLGKMSTGPLGDKNYGSIFKFLSPSESDPSKRSNWSKTVNSLFDKTNPIMKNLNPAIYELIGKNMSKSIANIYAGDSQWNDYTSLGSNFIGGSGAAKGSSSLLSTMSKLKNLGKVSSSGAKQNRIDITEEMMDIALSQQKSIPTFGTILKESKGHSQDAADIIARISESARKSKNSMVASLGYQTKNPLSKVHTSSPKDNVRGWYDQHTREIQIPSGKFDPLTTFHEMFHDSQALTGVGRVPFLKSLSKTGYAKQSGFAEAFKNENMFNTFLNMNSLNNRYNGYLEGQAEVAADLTAKHFSKNFDPDITPNLYDIKNKNLGYGTNVLSGSGYLFPDKYKFADLLQNKAPGNKYADPDFMSGLLDSSKSILTPAMTELYAKRIKFARKHGLSFDGFEKMSGGLDAAIAEAQALNLANGGIVQGYKNGGMAKDGWLQKYAKSLTGNPLSEMMGTAALLRKIAGVGQKGDNLSAAMMPLSFTGMGIGSKIGTSGGLMKALYSLPNKINQIKNQAKVNAMIKNGMWHGSQPQGHRGEDYLQGTNILDGAETHDPFYGMGFFGTTSKSEADLYASGYNSLNNWGQSSGSMNNIVGAPKGKYIDFTKGTNSLKWQNYELAQALGVKKNEYLGKYMTEKLGDVMSSQGMTGAIMNRVNAGRVPADIQDAKWLGWNNPAGVITKELGAASKGNGKSLGGIEKILSKLGDKSGSASAKMASIDKAALEKIGKNANQGWQEIQNARVAQLAKKYPDIDKLSVQKFNEIYAKEFYGLSPKDSLSIFKGDVIDAATAKATWDPSKASYFSRIPDVAAAYSDILRVAKSSQDKGGSILSSRLKISSLTNKLGEGIDPMSAQGMGEFPIKMTAENFQEIMQNLASHTPDEFAQLQGFASTGKKMGKYALDPMLGYAKAFGFANGGLLSIPRYSIGGMPQYNIPSDSMSVANKPFNRYNEGGLVNNYGGITVNGSPGMDEKMLAKYVMQEIKAADAINFASQGRPGSRYV